MHIEHYIDQFVEIAAEIGMAQYGWATFIGYGINAAIDGAGSQKAAEFGADAIAWPEIEMIAQ